MEGEGPLITKRKGAVITKEKGALIRRENTTLFCGGGGGGCMIMLQPTAIQTPLIILFSLNRHLRFTECCSLNIYNDIKRNKIYFVCCIMRLSINFDSNLYHENKKILNSFLIVLMGKIVVTAEQRIQHILTKQKIEVKQTKRDKLNICLVYICMQILHVHVSKMRLRYDNHVI